MFLRSDSVKKEIIQAGVESNLLPIETRANREI